MTGQSLQGVFEWIVGFDLEELRASVEALRRASPTASNAQLVRRVFRRAGWKSALAGTLMGFPTSLLVALPIAAVEQAVTLRLHAAAVARAALIYDPRYFDRPASRWDLLKPILAINGASNLLTVGGTLATGGVYELLGLSSDQALGAAAQASGGPAATVGSVLFDPLRLTAAKRRALLRVIPIAGGIIGGVWNWYEVRVLEWRVLTFFEGEASRTALVLAR